MAVKEKSVLQCVREVLLFLVLFNPVPSTGQFTLPLLYTPLKHFFSLEMGNQPKHLKLTSEHVRILEDWSLEEVNAQTMEKIVMEGSTSIFPFDFSADNLTNFDDHWSYDIPFDKIYSLAVGQQISQIVEAKTPAHLQVELLDFVESRFLFSIADVASRLSIPVVNLSQSYDPSKWDSVVHAMVAESSLTFTSKLELPSVDSLALLTGMELQELLNVNLSTYERLVFPFVSKKALFDTNTTASLLNSSGIAAASFDDLLVTSLLNQPEEVGLSSEAFGILYNLTTEQVKTIDQTTFSQISHMCEVSIARLLNMTLPEASWEVVGSMHVTPPCPVLITIKGEPISSFQNSSMVDIHGMPVLEILTAVTKLPWRDVFWALKNTSPHDWEYLDSVTLTELAELSGIENATLLNNSLSETVELIFALRRSNTLDNKTEAHRALVRTGLEKLFNLSINEVSTLIGIPEYAFQNASSPYLFASFLNATVAHFNLQNLSRILSAVAMTEEEFYNLPRHEWSAIIPYIVTAVVELQAIELEMTTKNVFQFLGDEAVNISIVQLKQLIRTRIRVAMDKRNAFENNLLSVYLNAHSVSDNEYVNSSVLSLLLLASSCTSEDLALIYDLNPDQIFILQGVRFKDLPNYCNLSTSVVKERTLLNITMELAGIRQIPAKCRTTKFYIEGRYKTMSSLREEFSAFADTSASFVSLVGLVTRLPWRENVWAFGLKMEDWTVLDVLNQDSFRLIFDLSDGDFQLRTFREVLEMSLQLQKDDDSGLRIKAHEYRAPTLNILYTLFSTNRDELTHFGNVSNAQYNDLQPIEVVSLVLKYLKNKFNVSLGNVAAQLSLQPDDLYNLSPAEWPEMIPPTKADIIRSGRHQLGTTPPNFAALFQTTSQGLIDLTFAQLESLWDNAFSTLLKGRKSWKEDTISQIVASGGSSVQSQQDVTVLHFIEGMVNVTKSQLLVLYNFSTLGIEVLNNYTFKELPGYCELTEEQLFNMFPYDLTVALLGYNNDMTCRKVALAVAAKIESVDESAARFNFILKNDVSMLEMFEDLFELPWPKIAWALNVSLPDWPFLGAVTLEEVASLTLETVANIKLLKSFKDIVADLVGLKETPELIAHLHGYRSNLVQAASTLFGVNSSKVCNDCRIVDILWNSLIELNAFVDFNPLALPEEMSVTPYEFNNTVPSQWPLVVPLIVKVAYQRAAVALAMDPVRLSTLLNIPYEEVLNMSLQRYVANMSTSIQPFIDTKTAFEESSMEELAATKGINLSAIRNSSVLDVIDSLFSVSIANISFMFNWTARDQALFNNYTLDYIISRSGGRLGSGSMFNLVHFISTEIDPLRPTTTPPPTTIPACKRGFVRESNDPNCTDVNECSSGEACGNDGYCQNYKGGHECECNDPALFSVNRKCIASLRFDASLTLYNEVFIVAYGDKHTAEFYDTKETFQTKMDEAFQDSPLAASYLGCRAVNFRKGSVIVDFMIFMSPQFTGTTQDLREAFIGRINSSYLGPYAVKSPIFQDFDECGANRHGCGEHATCSNTEGSFECKCDDGFSGDGRSCKAGFFKTMWWTVIVAALILLLMVIFVVILVVKGRKREAGGYGMGEPEETQQPPRRGSSKLSHRSGDALRPGTAPERGNDYSKGPHMPHFVEEDDTQLEGSVRSKTPLEEAVEKNARNGQVVELTKEEFGLPEEGPSDAIDERPASSGFGDELS